MAEYYEIGTQVWFRPVTPEYNDKNERYLKPLDNQEAGVVVGIKDVPLGRYSPGSYRPHTSYFGDDDYDPPYLAVDKVVRVYRIRQNLLGREQLSLIEDVRLCKMKFVVPLAGKIRQWLIGG